MNRMRSRSFAVAATLVAAVSIASCESAPPPPPPAPPPVAVLPPARR
jgi:hypothetical protein